MNQVQALLNQVESKASTSLLILMSWQAPRHKASLKAESFKAFEALAKQAFSADFVALKIDGQYQGVKEQSALLSFSDLSIAQGLSIIEDAIKLGKDLGQDSILTSSVKSSHLYSCQSGHVDATGQGYVLLDDSTNDDYSILNGIKFRLNLEF